MNNRIPTDEMHLLRQQPKINIFLTHCDLEIIIKQLQLISSDPINVNNPMGKETHDIESYLSSIFQLQLILGINPKTKKHKILALPFDIVVILIQLRLASTYKVNVGMNKLLKGLCIV
ncbi:hypothetical protein [Moorena sp. SIO3H5]|uniref:hypothetical protein n=1 Tax=Moorena sp. SIO3H5 TaxID=2607834 RepID=UPI0013BC6A96|nr:hypothetical protein [Moorena sp. SIO3H5]NEO74721.1 hypothetical protein [Moorena sp. SIO3H5]